MICLMFDFFTKNCSIKNMLRYNQHFCLHWSPFLVFYKEISLFKSEVSLESSLDIKIFVSFELLVSNINAFKFLHRNHGIWKLYKWNEFNFLQRRS